MWRAIGVPGVSPQTGVTGSTGSLRVEACLYTLDYGSPNGYKADVMPGPLRLLVFVHRPYSAGSWQVTTLL